MFVSVSLFLLLSVGSCLPSTTTCFALLDLRLADDQLVGIPRQSGLVGLLRRQLMIDWTNGVIQPQFDNPSLVITSSESTSTALSLSLSLHTSPSLVTSSS